MDFKDLWQKQTAVRPDLKELHTRVQQYKKASIKKLWIMNITLLGTIGLVVYIFFSMHNVLFTTVAGTALVLLSIIIYLLYSNKLFSDYKITADTISNSSYLKNLISIKNKQKLIQTKILSLYFILLSAGLCLYMYEPTLKMTLTGKILSYVITLAWISFVWFYLRPVTCKKQQSKIDELIDKFTSIEAQLTETEKES